MSVQERLMATGSWEITLSRSTPGYIRDLIVPFSHVCILPTRFDAPLSDAKMLQTAIFTGVVRRPGPQFTIGGPGLAMWLGDEDGGGPILTSAVSGTANSLATWVAALLPSQLTSGTVSGAGMLTHSVQWVSRRVALDTVVRYFWGLEWRVNPDFTVDVASADTLYGATPTVIATTDPATRDMTVAGLGVQTSIQVDFDDWASAVSLIGQAGVGAAGGASSYLDNNGAAVTWRRLVESTAAPAGQESSAASAVLTSISGARIEMSVATADWAPMQDVGLGARLAIWDPDNGIWDNANQMVYQGRVIHPLYTRVAGIRWPVVDGMGVWLRTHNGVTPTWTDLTNWVEWESGPTVYEIGSVARGSIASYTPPSTPVEVESSAWTTYTPTIANFTTGNGSVTGRYRRTGTTLDFLVRVVLGTTSAVTGAMTVSLPSGVTGNSAGTQSVLMLAGVGGVLYHGQATIAASASVATPWATTYNGAAAGVAYGYLTQLAAAVPAAWAAGDSFIVQGTIEVAP